MSRQDKIDRLVAKLTAQALSPVLYERKVVVFYDILGWRQKIAEAANDAESIRTLKTIVCGWSLLGGVDIQNRGHKTRVTTFSDNVVISEPVKGPNFQLMLFRLGYLQFFAAWSGILVRGAVTIGDIVHDENIVFGPALNRAYELESKMAVYPRIILDPKIGDEFGELPPFVAKDNKLSFVDPFTPLFLRNLVAQQERSGAKLRLDEGEAVLALVSALRREVSKPLGEAQWRKVEWLYERVCKAFGVPKTVKKYRLACTRFRRHRVRCFDGAGGGSWRDEGSRGSSSLRLCA